LNPGIQFGDVIKYVLATDNGLWTKYDTIIKTYGDITTQFVDEANNQTNWTGNWATTTSEYYSPSQSFTDSPTGDYANNANKTFTLNSTVDLTNVTAAGVSFYAKWAIENDYDFCQFQVSTDNGATWQGQCGMYTNAGNSANGSVQPNNEPIYDGSQSTWVLEEISLSDYIGQSLKMRFVFKSDGGTKDDGFYFDDFKIMYNIDDAALVENNLESAFVVPNPANNTAIVSFQNPTSNASIEVVDNNGKQVHIQSSGQLSNKIEFSVANWNEGIYYVNVIGENQAVNHLKLVIIH